MARTPEYATTYPASQPAGPMGKDLKGGYPGPKKEPLPAGPPRDTKFPKPSKPVK